MTVTARQRLGLIVRTVNLLRTRLEKNGNRYDGRMVPNLTSVTDLATLDDTHLEGVDAALSKLEQQG